MAVTPHLSTVTYLSDVGPPTVVTNLAAPNDTGAAFACCGDKLFVSYHAVGKHVSFDGRFLHAAPAEFARLGAAALKARVTLLFNVWLDHKPKDAADCGVREELPACGAPGARRAAQRIQGCAGRGRFGGVDVRLPRRRACGQRVLAQRHGQVARGALWRHRCSSRSAKIALLRPSSSST
mmetsp:Transcript_4419/g.13937  ORF Transcript_4419/g.13937 Transcript_4419/m.13937 type:complete len:180 (+) Transcript_4419:446-985(+)